MIKLNARMSKQRNDLILANEVVQSPKLLSKSFSKEMQP
jgi:hypothetical protein